MNWTIHLHIPTGLLWFAAGIAVGVLGGWIWLNVSIANSFGKALGWKL